MKRINVSHCILTIFCILVLCSCGKRKPEYIIGVSQCSDDAWRKKFNDELRIAAFSNSNVELKFSSSYDDAKLQMKQIDKFVDMKVDLLIVAPGQVTVSEAIERAYDKGIPVIVFDRRPRSDKYTAYIGADNEETGRNIARYLSAMVKKEEGKIVEICGLSTSASGIERRRGFDDEVAKHDNMDVVEHLEADWTNQMAYHKMDSLLSVPHTSFNYVFAHNDRMAMGAKKAARKHGLDLSKIHFIGIDAMPQKGGGMQLVRDGELLASYIYPTRGDKVMELAMDILGKKKFKKENLLSSALVTSDNASVLLMQDEELKRQSAYLLSLRKRVEATTNAFDTQRCYLFMLIFMVALLIIACVLAVKAYLAKTKYNARLKDSMRKQKNMTEEMERMTQKQLRFFTNVSHELRTPLTLISGPADRLAEYHGISGEARKLVEMIRRNVGILTQMVSEILEFRKIQNDKATLMLNRFDLASDLKTWADDFKTVAERKQIAISVVAAEEPNVVIADREKIAHIFFNLMTNAIKYTPVKGAIVISLKHADGIYSISVADNGKGMSGDDAQHIFERFYQASDSVGGTGIGLAIVKAYVDLHRGTVGVESEPSKGSVFTFTIPETQPGYDEKLDKQTLIQADTQLIDDYSVKDVIAKQNLSIVTGSEDYDSNRPLVLIIDDNASMRSYLRSILSLRYNVMEAQNGEEGLAVAKKNVPQLVVCDVMMPVMDGLEFCRLMKDDVSTCHIPIVLLTARTLDEQRAEAYNTGADSYITKPFSAETLEARVCNLLKNRSQLRLIFSGSQQEQQEQEALDDKDQSFIKQLRKVIKSHIPDADYSVEDLGDEMGLSRVQLYRKVKALTGYSVVDLLRKARLAKAKHLLETTDMNISEVAYEVGFTTPSYFTKRFKEEYGIKPGEVE